MKKTWKIVVTAVVMCCIAARLNAGTPSPQVNQPSPDFRFTEIGNWKKKTASLKDFSGKWLVIDAWSLGCTSCIAGFPVINGLNKQMSDKATFILVGRSHPNIRNWFAKYQEKYKLELPNTMDSAFFKLFVIYTVPRYIIIDPQGIIRAITTERPTREKLEQLFSGKNVFTTYSPDGPAMRFDFSKPFALHNNGAPDDQFLFRSILTRWTYGQDDIVPTFESKYNWSKYMKNGYQIMGSTLGLLYRLAYTGELWLRSEDPGYGRIWLEPVLECRDTSLFESNIYSGKNLFNYSLIVPDSLATNEYLQKGMQRDLKSYFGYDVVVEERDMPVWEVRAKRDLRALRTKGGKRIVFRNYEENLDYNMYNVTAGELVREIGRFQNRVPVINCLGIDYNIDVKLDCLPTDFNAVIAELEKQGIVLVKSTRKMQAVVIRDGKQ